MKLSEIRARMAEFKAEMAKLGVKDEDVLWYIDVNFPRDGRNTSDTSSLLSKSIAPPYFPSHLRNLSTIARFTPMLMYHSLGRT